MGVDGIDKADIFDEYFDDDKPKLTNYEKIKAMNIDEMAKHHALFARAVIDGALASLKLEPVNYPPMEVSIANQKQWLEQESEKE